MCGDFHFIKISFAVKTAQTFLETKNNCSPLFSPSQLRILPKSWLFYYFPRYFHKELQNALGDLFLFVSQESVLYVGIGDDLGLSFAEVLTKSKVSGKFWKPFLLRAALRVNPGSFRARHPMAPFPLQDALGTSFCPSSWVDGNTFSAETHLDTVLQPKAAPSPNRGQAHFLIHTFAALWIIKCFCDRNSKHSISNTSKHYWMLTMYSCKWGCYEWFTYINSGSENPSIQLSSGHALFFRSCEWMP